MSIAALLASCGVGSSDGDRWGASEAGTEETDEFDSFMARATLGPIRYEFDPQQLIMTDVVVRVPPHYDDLMWGMKLIPTPRVEHLGTQNCRYGHAVRDQTCDAQQEPGLMLALLPRPLTHYYEDLVKAGVEDELLPVELNGARGFAYTTKVGGGEIEYRFLPLDERTVLVAWHTTDASELGHAAIRDVIQHIGAGLKPVEEQEA